MDMEANPKNLIESFINDHVTSQGLDRRTEKAYRLDLELFYVWLGQKETQILSDKAGIDGERVSKSPVSDTFPNMKPGSNREGGLETDGWETWAENYLDYLSMEKKLSSSTISRKNKVLRYYLSYLARQGIISGFRPLIRTIEEEHPEKKRKCGGLTRKDADAFFEAMNREYENLDREFRRRICLRDMVMMELLFYHKIEISELLRMQAHDYDMGSGNLLIRRKRGDTGSVYLYSRELRRKMGMWLDERKHLRRDGEYGDTMFLSKFGKPLSMEMVVKIFDKYRELAGIDKEFTPRDLKEGVMKGYARELVMERWG